MSAPLQAKQLLRSTTSMFFIGWEMHYDENGHSYGQLVIGSFIMTMCLLMYHVSCRGFWQNIKSPRWLSFPIAQIWHPATSGFSQNYNHLWRGRDIRLLMSFRKIWQGRGWWFQERILQNVLNSRRGAGRTAWGPKVPTWKGLRRHCLMYKVSCIFFTKGFYFS